MTRSVGHSVRRWATFAMVLLIIALVLGMLGILNVIGRGYLPFQWALLGISIVILTVGQIRLSREKKRLRTGVQTERHSPS